MPKDIPSRGHAAIEVSAMDGGPTTRFTHRPLPAQPAVGHGQCCSTRSAVRSPGWTGWTDRRSRAGPTPARLTVAIGEGGRKDVFIETAKADFDELSAGWWGTDRNGPGRKAVCAGIG